MKKTIAFLLSLATLFSLCACGTTDAVIAEVDDTTTALSSLKTEDGGVSLFWENGNAAHFNDSTKSATITEDRNHIVVLKEDGRLYYCDSKLENNTDVAKNVTSFSNVRNDGFFLPG